MRSRFALALSFFLSLLVVQIAAAEPIQGSGSTFAQPLVQRLSMKFVEFLADGNDSVPTDSRVEYEPVGSLGGILRLSGTEVDFALSDYPLSVAELETKGFAQFPIVTGAIVPVINVTALKDKPINLPGAVLADIYLGKVQNWSDAAISAVNPGLALPDLPITVLHRVDGSGTTYNWTAFLSASSAEWRGKYGTNSLISWPLGKDVRGSRGMASEAAATDGSIGYLEFGQAKRAGLAMALVENAQKRFALPEEVSVSAAAASAEWSPANHFATSLVNASAPDSYPITTAVYAIMKKDGGFGSDNRLVLRFMRFIMNEGKNDALELGYVPLPAPAVESVKSYWKQQFDFGS